VQSYINGLILGFDWETNGIDIEPTKQNNNIQYFVGGLIKWKLLGATIYTQNKDYSGIISLKSDNAR
jgi:hypothetical protein